MTPLEAGELACLRNRVAALEANGNELLVRAEQAEAETERLRAALDRLWTPGPDSAGRHAVHCEWHTSSGAYCSCIGLTEITRLRAERDALGARLTGVAIHAHRLKTWINDDKASITIAGSILGDLFAALDAPTPTTRTETA